MLTVDIVDGILQMAARITWACPMRMSAQPDSATNPQHLWRSSSPAVTAPATRWVNGFSLLFLASPHLLLSAKFTAALHQISIPSYQ